MNQANPTMNPDQILNSIRKALNQQSDPQVAKSSLRFFKEPITTYGVRVPVVNQIAKQHIKQMVHYTKEDVFKLCQNLWQSGYLEEALVACHWSFALKKEFTASDLQIFEGWVQAYITNWATCDTFCNHTLGAYFEQYPQNVSRLFIWAHSDNQWVRRAAAVSLIIPARKGLFLPEVFQISNLLMNDKEDLVQKGYGWLLKVARESHRDVVFEYLMKNKTIMPRTAFRYALEKMPKELRDIAMGRKVPDN